MAETAETINVIMKEDTSKDSRLDKAIKIFKVLVIPVTIAGATTYYANEHHDASISLKYVELSINILNSKPTNETKDLREWAVDILNKNAPLKLNKSVEDSLVNDIPIANNDSMYDMIFKGRHKFYWDKNIKVVSYEIQKRKDKQWQLIDGKSLNSTENSFSINLPPDTRLRWRVGVNTDSNLSNWQEIDNSKPSGNHNITSIIKGQMNN